MSRTPSNDDTAVERVLRGLRDDIIGGTRPGGEHLVERAIAEEYEVSRLPVRIAMRRLVLDGLVDQLPRRGSFVRVMTRSDVADVAELHSAFDRLAVRRAAMRRSTADVERFRRDLDAAESAEARGDAAELARVGMRFRSDAYRASRSRPLLEIHDVLLCRTQRMFALAEPSVTAPLPYYRRFLSAFERGDSDAVEAAMAEFSDHLRAARQERMLRRLDGALTGEPAHTWSAERARLAALDAEPAAESTVSGECSDAQLVLDGVRADVVGGRRAPGEVLSERTLAQEYGVGRIPVRQAIDALALEGLATAGTSRVSARVRAVPAEEAGDFFDICVTLDVLASRLAAQRPTREELALLEQCLLAEERTPLARTEELLDRMFAFRRQVYVMAENRLLLEIGRLVEARMRMLVADAPLAAQVKRGHRFLFEAIASRETGLAEAVYLSVFTRPLQRDRLVDGPTD
ncbi:GntR family transcriptional regulator [Agromyces soli]|uniref:GntR family transcriptional regulator n=1 Tax=Agromyces soli TaxID=659012 RepID=A0ABY4AVS7_9MICO|nr:GntR family transcriptional regulator [Agromyces soli]UOE27280.1 GntR family transcriptional regulator [Agromyces soli]